MYNWVYFDFLNAVFYKENWKSICPQRVLKALMMHNGVSFEVLKFTEANLELSKLSIHHGHRKTFNKQRLIVNLINSKKKKKHKKLIFFVLKYFQSLYSGQ